MVVEFRKLNNYSVSVSSCGGIHPNVCNISSQRINQIKLMYAKENS